MAITVRVKPDKELAKSLELFAVDDLLGGGASEDAIRILLRFDLAFDLLRQLFVLADQSRLIEVLGSRRAGPRASLLGSATHLGTKELLPGLRVIQIVRQRG